MASKAIAWSLSTGNCSESSEDTVDISYSNQTAKVSFTTRNGMQPPDLGAASADNNVCAAPSPTRPTADPCGAAVNTAAAASISAAITANACAWQNPNVTCPSPSRSAATKAMMFPRMWSACVLFWGLIVARRLPSDKTLLYHYVMHTS